MNFVEQKRGHTNINFKNVTSGYFICTHHTRTRMVFEMKSMRTLIKIPHGFDHPHKKRLKHLLTDVYRELCN